MADGGDAAPCTLLLAQERGTAPSVLELRAALTKGEAAAKAEALKTVIELTVAGEDLSSQMLMPVIQNCSLETDHTLIKLVHLFFEVLNKRDPDGTMKPQMIMICNALLRHLQSANEFVRGCTLRFLCTLKEGELLEPLLQAVRENLQHAKSYVRRCAVLAVGSIYANFEMIQDAPELLSDIVRQDKDSAVRRNAFIMLVNIDLEAAVRFMMSVLDTINNFDVSMQLLMLEVIRRVNRAFPHERSKFLRATFALLSSESHAVKFDAAHTLTTFNAGTTAQRAAARALVDILVHESDNNIKLIVLDRIREMQGTADRVMQDLIMDIVGVLLTPNIELRERTLRLAFDLLSPKNVRDVVGFLKKELVRSQSADEDQSQEYRRLLVETIHKCADRFPDVAGSVIDVLLEALSDCVDERAAHEVIDCAKEVLDLYPALRADVVRKLVGAFHSIRSASVYRAALWTIGEFCRTGEEIALAFNTVKTSLGTMPFSRESGDRRATERAQAAALAAAAATSGVRSTSSVATLSDGTYASQSAYQPETQRNAPLEPITLRHLLLAGDFVVAAVAGVSLTKLALRAQDLDMDASVKHGLLADVMFVMVHMIKFGRSDIPVLHMDHDIERRLFVCINALTRPTPSVRSAFLDSCAAAFSELMVQMRTAPPPSPRAGSAADGASDVRSVVSGATGARSSMSHGAGAPAAQIDERATFRALSTGNDQSEQNEVDLDLMLALGVDSKPDDLFLRRLRHTQQLTGLSDPVYVEAAVSVQHYDIVLDFLVVNRNKETLQNVAVELAVLGDLKVCDRPQNYMIGPFSSKRFTVSVKVACTESGIIYGSLVYNVAGSGSGETNVVTLNALHVDIMDYVRPVWTSDHEFRRLWQDCGWENKVVVHSNLRNTIDYIRHVMEITNMRCLTPDVLELEDPDFVACTLSAKTIFGENVLGNISVEKQPDGRLTGFTRIRASTQGLALGVGDRIKAKQRLQPLFMQQQESEISA